MKDVTLYTKLRCQLCDEAYRVLLDIACDVPMTIDIVDVSHPHNRDIWTDYYQRIPVLSRSDMEAELDWPFTSEEIMAYLE